MKVKYKLLDKPLLHYKIIECDYCCKIMEEQLNSTEKYIFLTGNINECPWCNEKIELEKVI